MAIPAPEPGLVISYGYLWRAEYARGREEGTKNRPCVIVIAVRSDGGHQVVTVVPVTHSAPESANMGVEIPLATKQRLGLDDARSWVIVSEGNQFIWPGPDIRPLPRDRRRIDYGLLPPGLFRQIRDQMKRFGTRGRIGFVPRGE